MSLASIRDEYRVPARIGARVTVRSPYGLLHGTITGADGDLIIVLPDRSAGHVAFYPTQLTFHPTTQGA